MTHLTDPYLITIINIGLALITSIGLLIYRYIYPKKKIRLSLLLLIISILPIISLFRQGTFQAGDLRAHTAQLVDFYYNLQEGNLVPQWAGDLCGEYGCPVYEIEYTLPYYIASFFHFLGFSFLISLKLVLATSFIASGFTMFWWAKEEFGDTPGFVAAIFYLFAPYHLIDLHFRGSIGEILSFVFIPLLFLFCKRLIERKKTKYFFLLAITIWLILLSQSSTTIISLPLTILYGGIVWIRKKNKKINEILLFLLSIIYGIAISTYYWLPALHDVQYTWWRFTSYGDFKSISEYLYSPIAYGLLFQGHQGEFRLIIGYPHVIIILIALYLIISNKIHKKLKMLLIFFLINFFVLFYMLLSQSKFIWEHISLLHTFILVWRLLVPISFITSAIAAIVIKNISNSFFVILICYVVIFSTVLNWANRKMVPPLSNPFVTADAVYTEYFETGNRDYIKEYEKNLPRVDKILANPPAQSIEFLIGKGNFVTLKHKQIVHEYTMLANSDVIVKENTEYFPGWEVTANNSTIPINNKQKLNNSLGKITFSLKKGLYLIDVSYKDTPLRSISKLISFCALLFGLAYVLLIKLKKNYK